jgi:hypothetical protein
MLHFAGQKAGGASSSMGWTYAVIHPPLSENYYATFEYFDNRLAAERKAFIGINNL